MPADRRTLALLLLLALTPTAWPAEDEQAAADAKLLREAGVSANGAALRDFFRRRTPTPADGLRLDKLVRQLGSERFREREEASRRLRDSGPLAVPFLKRAAAGDDAEAARRARECLADFAHGPGPALPAAAARLLARNGPPGTAAVLLAYLPQADDEEVENAVLDALAAQADRDGPAAAALNAARTDPVACRRAAAGYVLGRSRAPERRGRARRLLADPDVRVRWRTAQGLLAGGDSQAVPALIDLLPEVPVTIAWQIEERLACLAGDQVPQEPAGDDAAARRGRRTAWVRWWRATGGRIDLARLDQAPRYLGLTLVPEMHAGKVWECGRDGKVLWELGGLLLPIDAHVLPGGRVLVAELRGNRVSERDRTGKVLWEHKINVPIACQRLPNGHTFIGTNHHWVVVTRAGRAVSSYTAEAGFFIHSVQHQANGHVVCVSMDGRLREVDGAGKVLRTLPLPPGQSWSGVEAVPGHHYLAVSNNQGKVVEVDGAGKVVWEHARPGACYASRLPGGHTLIAGGHLLVEVDRTGKVVWEKKVSTPLWRVHRR